MLLNLWPQLNRAPPAPPAPGGLVAVVPTRRVRPRDARARQLAARIRELRAQLENVETLWLLNVLDEIGYIVERARLTEELEAAERELAALAAE